MTDDNNNSSCLLLLSNVLHFWMSVNFAIMFMVAAERFALLSKAKETLTNPESRSKYDKWRRSGIAMSYEDWCGLRGAVHTVSEQENE